MPTLSGVVGEDIVVLRNCQQFLKGTQNINIGLLSGLGNTSSGFRITLVGYWAVGVPAMLLLAYGLHMRGPGVRAGLCVGFGATAILLLRRIRTELNLDRAAALSPP
jgi:MATE family multidrug resistance protein